MCACVCMRARNCEKFSSCPRSQKVEGTQRLLAFLEGRVNTHTHLLEGQCERSTFQVGEKQIKMFCWQVTTDGRPVYPLNSPHKKPYEVTLLGRYRKPKLSDGSSEAEPLKSGITSDDSPADSAATDESALHHDISEGQKCPSNQNSTAKRDSSVRQGLCEESSEAAEEPHIPDNKVIVSVPCSIHSCKPPLIGTEVLCRISSSHVQ